MALITEDGTGLVDSESYGSVVGGDSYFAAHGSPSEWVDATEANKESALRYSTAWHDDNFSWYSTLYTTTQALNWPRNQYVDANGRTVSVGVPLAVEYSTYEIAVEWLNGSLNSTDLENVASESVGASSVTYKGNGSKSYSAVKLSLRLYGSSGKSSVVEVFRA